MLVVAVCTLAPANAVAAAPHWLNSVALGGSEGYSPSPLAAVAPDGTAVVTYKHGGDPTQVLYAAVRNPDTREWSTPTQISSDGYVNEVQLVAGLDGNITVAWNNRNGDPFVKTRTYAASSWGATQTLATGHSGFKLAAAPGGGVVVALGVPGPTNVIQLLTRSSKSTTFDGDPQDVASTTNYVSQPAVAYNSQGDGVLTWVQDLGNGHTAMRAAQYNHVTHLWSDTDTGIDETDNIGGQCLAIDDSGNAALLWGVGQVDGGAAAVGKGAAMSPDGSWSSATTIGRSDHGLLATDKSCVAPDQHGHFVAIWQDYPLDGDDHAIFPASEARTATLDVASRTWDLPSRGLGEPAYGGAPSVAADSAGNIVAVKLGSSDNEHLQYVSFYRPATGSAFTSSDGNVAGEPLVADLGAAWCGVPDVTTDADGNFFTSYGTGEQPSETSDCRVGFSIGDASGPDLRDFTAQTSGTAGETFSFSVSPFDTFSALGSTSWDFGDGETADGTDVTHTFATAGTYTVTARSSDVFGSSSSDSRTVTVAAPPPPPAVRELPPVVQPPVKLPPVIPARLAGKKIAITVTVPSCSSKFVATTKFGTTNYQTRLKLTKSGKVCTGTGVIVLKKAPSARTKLRVGIGRVTKDGTNIIATLTTKRG